jgi:ferredoxin
MPRRVATPPRAEGAAVPRVEINYRTCLKTGQCYYLHPEGFRQREDDHPEPVQETFPPELREALVEAAELCPTESITVIDD